MHNLFRLCRKNRSTCSIRQCCFDNCRWCGRGLTFLLRLIASLWSYVYRKLSFMAVVVVVRNIRYSQHVFASRSKVILENGDRRVSSNARKSRR